MATTNTAGASSAENESGLDLFKASRVPVEARQHLRCPGCCGTLTFEKLELRCDSCSVSYPLTSKGGVDLRPQGRVIKELTFEITAALPVAATQFEAGTVAPEVDFRGVDIPRHLSAERLARIPKGSPGEFMLDVGCGKGAARRVGEYAGFIYVGLDYEAEKAPILGDAHALPFANETFSFVLSLAVYEHLRFPAVAAAELFRVMKPGASLFGSVSFHEPFHESFYHHTHVGVLNTFWHAGFEVERIVPSTSQALKSQQKMLFGSFPPPHEELPKQLEALQRQWWRIGCTTSRFDEAHLQRATASNFEFLCHKPR